MLRLAAAVLLLSALAVVARPGPVVADTLAKVDQGVHMVDTGHNGDGVQTAHDEGTDAERQLN